MKPHEKSQVDLGAAPDMLESLAQRLRKDEMRARLFGQPSEPVRVGKFVLKERLGEGSMGVVYVAHDEQLHRTVALKLMYLGQAEQQTGDLEGACRSYRVVLDRWGKGPVRSVTADRVRALMREARCPEER